MNQVKDALNDILSNLDNREKQIILSRFGILNNSKKSLNDLSLTYNLSRERIRQIQNKALSKIYPVLIKNEYIKNILEQLKEFLLPFGIRRDSEFFIRVKNFLNFSQEDIENLKFCLFFYPDIIFHKKGDIFYNFYAKDKSSYEKGRSFLKEIYNQFFVKKDIVEEEKIVDFIIQRSREIFKIKPQEEEALNLLKVLNGINKSILNFWGPSSHFYISPKSLKHKILHILEHEGKPLHFKEIAEKINSFSEVEDDYIHRYWRKKYNVNSIKNELIKYQEFVFIGKGYYALRKWGLIEGTAKEVLIDLLKNNKKILKEALWEKISSYKLIKRSSFDMYLKKIKCLRQEGDYLIYDG